MEIANTKLNIKRHHEIRVVKGQPWIFSNEIDKVQQEIKNSDEENSVLKDKKSKDISQYVFSLKT